LESLAGGEERRFSIASLCGAKCQENYCVTNAGAKDATEWQTGASVAFFPPVSAQEPGRKFFSLQISYVDVKISTRLQMRKSGFCRHWLCCEFLLGTAFQAVLRLHKSCRFGFSISDED